MNDDISKLAAINAAQIQKLTGRLKKLGLIDPEDDPDEEVGIAFINDARTGDIITAIDTGTSMYWEAGTELIEQVELSDGLWHRRLGDHGQPVEDWTRRPPPPSRSSQN
jgi:hypothetical protein